MTAHSLRTECTEYTCSAPSTLAAHRVHLQRTECTECTEYTFRCLSLYLSTYLSVYLCMHVYMHVHYLSLFQVVCLSICYLSNYCIFFSSSVCFFLPIGMSMLGSCPHWTSFEQVTWGFRFFYPNKGSLGHLLQHESNSTGNIVYYWSQLDFTAGKVFGKVTVPPHSRCLDRNLSSRISSASWQRSKWRDLKTRGAVVWTARLLFKSQAQRQMTWLIWQGPRGVFAHAEVHPGRAASAKRFASAAAGSKASRVWGAAVGIASFVTAARWLLVIYSNFPLQQTVLQVIVRRQALKTEVCEDLRFHCVNGAKAALWHCLRFTQLAERTLERDDFGSQMQGMRTLISKLKDCRDLARLEHWCIEWKLP